MAMKVFRWVVMGVAMSVCSVAWGQDGGGASGRPGGTRSDGRMPRRMPDEYRRPAVITRLDGTAVSARDVDAAVKSAMEKWKVPGLGLAVICNGRLVYQKGYGYRDVEQKLPFDVVTSTYAASLTKTVFGYVALQLVDQGVIALDTPIATYLAKPLPEYDNYKELAGDERWRKFTPRMLLAHTS